jgi:hypothetical protein
MYVSQLIPHAQACSLYITTHALRSDLQFVFHNSYITLRLTVYISQLTHYAQAYSLYFTTHASRSGLEFIWNTNCKSERDVWVVKYKLKSWAWCMSCDIWTVSLSVMYELGNINCKSERNVWVVKYKLQAWFIFHNSYITLRLAVYISQLIHYA